MSSKNVDSQNAIFILKLSKREYEWLKKLLADYLIMFEDEAEAVSIAKKLKIRKEDGYFKNYVYEEVYEEW